MITRFRIFEKKKIKSQGIEPQVGDYVLCTTEPRMEPFAGLSSEEEMEQFFNTNIAKISRIEPTMEEPNIRIIYKYTPKNMEKCFIKEDPYQDGSFTNSYIWISKANIIHLSKTKKELEQFVDASKFGI